jgi:hypothetical protein
VESSGLKIFISYGRADASEFVDRLSRDLTAAGFEIWRDTAHIRAGQAWDAEVAAAIKNSDVMVAILTPHAVRGGSMPVAQAEASVCVDELRSARFDKPATPIVPIMLIPCEAPFIIARLQWIDFQAACNESTQYQAALARLFDTIRQVKSGKLLPYRTVAVEPLDFDLYLKEKTRDFVGREWLLTEILDRLPSMEPPVLLLVGEAGWGKTAFASHLFRTDPGGHLLAAHFCRADRVDSISPRRFVESVAAFTGLRMPAFAERLSARLASEPEVLGKDPAQLFERMFLDLLGAVDPGSLGPLPRYLLVDALDETVDDRLRGGLHRLLARASTLFPDWLRLIATTRDAFGIVEAFPSASIIRLDRGDPRNRADVRLLVERRLRPSPDANGGEALEHGRLCAAIEAKAQGNALVAAQLAVAARKSGLAADAVEKLPQGLSALYRALLERRFDPRSAEWAAARDVLEMVMATDAAVPISLIAAARGDAKEYDTRAAVDAISDLLATQNHAIQLFHQTFREFLQERLHPFFVNPKAGATRLAGAATTTAPERALQSFGENEAHVLKRWIAQSENPAQHVDLLRKIYRKDFARKFPLYDTPVDSESLPDDVPLIAAMVRADQVGALISVIEMAFETADSHIRAALAGGTLQNPPARDAAEFASFFQPSMWLANFGIICIREIAQLAPGAKPKLREALKRADVFSFFTFFGPALGYRHYGVSSYYEVEADYLSAEYNKLDKELEQAAPAPATSNSSGTRAPIKPILPSFAQQASAAFTASTTSPPAAPIHHSNTGSKVSSVSPGNLPAWLLNSGEDIGVRGEVLVAWYESELAREDFGSPHAFGAELTDIDRQVIAGLARSERKDCLLRVPKHALGEAVRRFEASGASMSREQTYTEEQHGRLVHGLERSCRLSSFALDWCATMANISDEYRSEAKSILRDQKLAPYLYFLGWLDVADGCDVLGIGFYYEYLATSIRFRCRELGG